MNCLWRRFICPGIPFILINTKISTKHLHSFVSTNVLYKCSAVTSLQNKSITYTAFRSKSKKSQAQADSDGEDEVYDDDTSLNRDSKVVKLNTTSLRTDLILKSALGIARNKIEQQFYESKIRINGKKLLKKSVSVRLGDEIDVIKMVSPKNPDHLYVSRIEILNIAAKEEAIAITARRFKNLLIENYANDPYKGGQTEETQ